MTARKNKLRDFPSSQSSPPIPLTASPVPTTKMAVFHPRRLAILLGLAIVCVYAEKHATSIASMSIPEIEGKLQVRRAPCIGPLVPHPAHKAPGMPSRSRPQQLQTSDVPADFESYIAHIRGAVPRQPSRECHPRYTLHLRPSQFPPRVMSAEYRSLVSVCYGCVCSWWSLG
jgi:hypothetical protein